MNRVKFKCLAAVVSAVVAFCSNAGTFLEDLAASANRVVSSPYATGGDLIFELSGQGMTYVHVFTNTAPESALTYGLTPLRELSASVLVVGGGGSGSICYMYGGGGGGGGVAEVSHQTLAKDELYLATVGAGGDPCPKRGTVYAGAASSFAGFGVSVSANGGGAGRTPYFGGGGTSGNGFAGSGAGGGGAGGASDTGDGGVGLSSVILGFEQHFGGGGAANGGMPGLGGGGTAYSSSTNCGGDGVDGLGGGAGSGGQNEGTNSGAGGNGLVVVRYIIWDSSAPLIGSVGTTQVSGSSLILNGAVDSFGAGAQSADIAFTMTPPAGSGARTLDVTIGSDVAAPGECGMVFSQEIPGVRAGLEYEWTLTVENNLGESATKSGTVCLSAVSVQTTGDCIASNFTGQATKHIWVFTNATESATFTSAMDMTVRLLAVGGGGSGSICYGYGGAGGGGAAVENNLFAVEKGVTYTIEVGQGGAACTARGSTAAGTASRVLKGGAPVVTAAGGQPGSAPYFGQGGNSGNGHSGSGNAGGGAGGGGAGGDASAGNGGIGFSSDITGLPVYYGGGGAANDGVPGLGGGGTAYSGADKCGGDGVDGLGGGGGSGGQNAGENSGAGGDGIVIIFFQEVEVSDEVKFSVNYETPEDSVIPMTINVESTGLGSAVSLTAVAGTRPDCLDLRFPLGSVGVGAKDYRLDGLLYGNRYYLTIEADNGQGAEGIVRSETNLFVFVRSDSVQRALFESPLRVDSSPYATGGDVILKFSETDYAHVYLGTKSVREFVPGHALDLRCFAVGGGGSGSICYMYGGAGGGGAVQSAFVPAAECAARYSIVVGQGGSPCPQRGTTYAGGDSRILDSGDAVILSALGGRPGTAPYNGAGGSSGSGKSGAIGGGGAGLAANGGDGGIGLASDILGFASYFGGGGAARTGTPGLGGGGTAYSSSTNCGGDGVDGLGGGGGSGGENAGQNSGGGGNGIVVIRYNLASYVWTGAAEDDRWGSAANWHRLDETVGEAIPDSGSAVRFPAGRHRVELTGNVTVSTLSLEDDADVTFAAVSGATPTLTVANDVVCRAAAATLKFDGVDTAWGSWGLPAFADEARLVLANGATVTRDGDLPMPRFDVLTFEVSGGASYTGDSTVCGMVTTNIVNSGTLSLIDTWRPDRYGDEEDYVVLLRGSSPAITAAGLSVGKADALKVGVELGASAYPHAAIALSGPLVATVDEAVKVEMLSVNGPNRQEPILTASEIVPESVILGDGLKKRCFFFYKGEGAMRYQTPEEASAAGETITGVWYRYAPSGLVIILR